MAMFGFLSDLILISNFGLRIYDKLEKVCFKYTIMCKMDYDFLAVTFYIQLY